MKKTTLITKIRLYDWTIMPFGLKNATSTFTKTISEVFRDLGNKFLKVFVNDFNRHNESWEEHLQHLDVVFFKLSEVNLKLNPNKCCFATKNLHFCTMWLIRKAPDQIREKLRRFYIFQNHRWS